MLQDYRIQTRDLLKDSRALFWDTPTLDRNINIARQQVATLSGCIRILVPGTVAFGGGAVPGSMIPGGGTPGLVNTTFQTIAGVEKYAYTFANNYVRRQNQHVAGISDVISCAISWGGVRPALDWAPWEDLQAYYRSYNVGVTSYPSVWSTYGDGQRGQVWLFPVPQTALEMEWDTFCYPKPLVSDSDYEALPPPFSDYVPFYAAHLCYLGSQRMGMADAMLTLFEKNSGLARYSSDRGKTSSFYWGSYRA